MANDRSKFLNVKKIATEDPRDVGLFNQMVEQFKNVYTSPLDGYQSQAKSLKEAAIREKKSPDSVKGAIELMAEDAFKKYKPYLEGLDGWAKVNAALQMQNADKVFSKVSRMQESTFASAINVFQKFAFPLIRAILPELATEKLFNIQTMFGPTSNIFYFDYVYGTTTGTVSAGQSLFENYDATYGNSEIDLEVDATADGIKQSFTFTLDHQPVLAGTLQITDGSQILTDDGNGNLVGDGNGTVNYTSGAVVANFNAVPASGDDITSSYSVDTEGNTNGIPEIDLVLTTKPVSARSKKLRFRWSFEAQFALRDQFGLEAESELLNAAGAEIGYGIDIVNVQNVQRVAIDKRADATYQFAITPPSGVSRQEHYQGFAYYLVKASNYILSQSGRAIGNRVVGGDNFTTVVETIGKPRFEAKVYDASRGVHEIGTLDNRWICFRALFMDSNEYIVLYKSDDFLRAGYVWAPWITAFTTPTAILDDFQGRKGIGSLFGQKIVNPNMYIRMKFGA